VNVHVHIRPEHPDERAEVFRINSAAFPDSQEAFLVDRLRSAIADLISLVAEVEEEIVGHILFTPVTIHQGTQKRSALGLGPMAVLPRYQRQGIGSKLVVAGLEACAAHGEQVVVVVGHPEFYPKFGFLPARPKGLRYKDERYDPYFFVAELQEGALEGIAGTVEYHSEFDKLE
jgi:putative acetyltransferase